MLEQMAAEGNGALAAELQRMAARAQHIVPELVGLSFGVLDDGLTFTLEASDADAAEIDTVQYLDGGPCLAGAHDGEVLEVAVGDITDEHAWHMFARITAAKGIGSSLTLPVEIHGDTLGSINLYASTSDAFTGRHEALAGALGASALDAIANADLTFSTRLEAQLAPERYADQDDIDIAIGVICTLQKVDSTLARERLRMAAARAGITEGQAARALRHTYIE